MKAKDLHSRTKEDLHKMVGDAQGKLQQLRFELPSGKVKNVRDIRKTRRDVARMLTVLSQKNQ